MKIRLRYDPVLEHLAQVNRDARTSEKSRWWCWLLIIGAGVLLGWLLINSCAEQRNPGPPVKVGKVRVVA